MSNKSDKFITRALVMITKLNQGEKLITKELAQDFGVSIRVIQKDLNERLMQILPLVRKNGEYYLESFMIGKLEYKDIQNFAILSGIKKLYPSLDENFLSDILNFNINNTCLVNNGDYEDISAKRGEFELIKIAIKLQHQLSFKYKNKVRVVHPYKLLNQDNIWYLVASEDDKLKTFSFTKISQLKNIKKPFSLNKEFSQMIEKNQAKWFSQKSINVILEIDNEVKEYFLRRQLFSNQTILKDTKEKLILKTKISYDDEILRVVRYWIPHVQIIEPDYLQQKLLDGLSMYIKK